MACFLYNQAQNILSKLPGKEDRQEHSPIYLKRLEYTMLTLKAVLVDAEEKQEQDNDLRHWLRELQPVFYQIADTIDEFKWEDSQREVLKQEGIGKKVRAPFLCSDPVAYKSQLARRMRKLCDELDTIAAKVYEFHLTERNQKHLAHTRMEMTHSFHSASQVSARLIKPYWPVIYALLGTPRGYLGGRNNDILEDFNKPDHNFFHIVGDAGTGKSTLAKFIYQKVSGLFSMRIWVCVEEDFDTHRLIKEILNLATGEEDHNNLTEEQLLFKVKQSLREQMYLLVIQDLTIENLDNLTMLMDILREGNSGSKIIVTTPSEAVADATGIPSEVVADAKEPSNKNDVEGLAKKSLVTTQSKTIADPTEPSNINNVQGLPEQNSRTTQGKDIANTTKPSNSDNVEGLVEQNSVTNQGVAVAATGPSHVNNIQGLGEQNPTTTQSETVADATQPSSINDFHKFLYQATMNRRGLTRLIVRHQTIYKIKGLSNEQSFSLFREHAFRDAQHAQNPEINKIAEQIVQKCKGVPLAIKCLGGLLSSKARIAEWKNVRDNIWAQEEKDGNILPALRLCYSLMPSNLKRCFLQCSQLPNDRMFSSNDLIQLWMAHGLLHSTEEKNLSLENIGEKYFKELWERCFFQDIEEYGLGYWFKMHPLIRKLARIVAQEQAESSIGSKPVTEIRYIALQTRESVPPSESLANKCISRFKYLRLLYLGNTDLQEIPNAIGTLKYLRYLDLQANKRLKQLPDSICDLQSLQTLILASCSELEELPGDIRNLISLRYLWVTTNRLRLQKNSVGLLTSLRFLAVGGCGGDDLQNLFEKVECLAGLETLMIYDCRTLKSLPNGIGFLKSLQNLVIWGCKKLTITLEKVEFRLQRFTIRDLPKVDELPQWLQESAETLRILDICNCPILVDQQKLQQMYEAVERFHIIGIVKLKVRHWTWLQSVNIRIYKRDSQSFVREYETIYLDNG